MVSSSSFLSDLTTDRVDPEAAPRLMVGAASPLWLMFGGAAAAGATWWWWASRWREAVNLEAKMALTPELVATPIPEPEAIVEAALETLEATVEAVVEPTEILAEATVEAVVETLEAANDAVVETAEVLADAVDPVAEVEPAVELLETPSPIVTAPVEPATIEAPVEEAAAVLEAAPELVADDLTRVVGIGPKLAASLSELGVVSFNQIAAWTPEELATIDQQLNLKGRAERDAWIAQAKRFGAGSEG